MDSCLEEVVFTDYRVEKGLHVDTTVLISVKFEECRGTEEMSELKGEFGGYGEEGVVVQTFLIIMRWGDIFFEKLMELLKI